MSKKLIVPLIPFSALFFFLTTPISSQLSGRYEVYYAWNLIDPNFPNETVRQELTNNGGYIPKNCIPNAIKVQNDLLYMATPRYFNGVPITLSVIPYKKPWIDQWFKRNKGPKLTPFPSWEMQEIGNCSAFQLAHALELDPYNRLWVVDVGRIEVLLPIPRNLCPPKLVIIDLTTNKVEKIHEFPNEVVSHDSNALKDIQVACTSRSKCLAYVSNINTTHSIVVYDLQKDESWYATHPSMLPDLTRAPVTVNGTTTLVPFGITGLGLTPRSTNYGTIYFSKLAGDHIYTVSTSFLNNGQVLKENPILPLTAVRDLRPKPQGNADGQAMDNNGRLYYGSLQECAVYSIDTSANPMTLPMATRHVRSMRDMQWIDAFCFDNQGSLLFTTNKFQKASLVDPADINFRIIKFYTDSYSYQYL